MNLAKDFNKVVAGLLISLSSVLIFIIAAEIVVRIVLPDIIPSTAYDWSSRHKGYSLQKPANTFRIVVLGDSYTFGQGVRSDETFPKQLEKMLNTSKGGVGYEVINLGFCGMNTVVEKEILAERGINPETWSPDESYRGLAYRPDLILLQYTLNDSSTSWRRLEIIKQFDDKWRTGEVIVKVNSGPYSIPLPETVDKFLTINSRFYLFVLDRYNQLLARFGLREGGLGHIDATLQRYDDEFEGWKYVEQSLLDISNTGRGSGIPVVMAVYPDMVSLSNYPYKVPHEKVRKAGEAVGLKVLDMLPAFEGKDENTLKVSRYDGHPNAVAHSVVAAAIYEYMIKEGLVPLKRGDR